MQLPSNIKKLFPYKSHNVKISGFDMHYVDVGEGPVVILLHGNPTWCFYYRQLIESLRDKFRLIAPDFIGCGLSEHPTDVHLRASQRIKHLGEFIDTLGLEKYSLVMHDWGGSIGSGLAVRRPEAIENLVYLNTTLTETESLPKIITNAAKPIIGKYLTKTSKRFLKLATSFGVVKKLPKDVVKGYHFPYKTSARRTAIWDFVADIPFDSKHPSYADMLFLADNLPNLSHIPVKIVWGLRDPCFHREMLSKVAEHFPQADVLEIPDAGHLVLEDAPELANGAIRSFLLSEKKVAFSENNSKQELKINPLYSAFQEVAKENGETLAAIMPSFLGDSVKYSQLSYKQFNSLVNKYQRGMAKLGLEKNDRVLMLVPPSIDFLALSLSVMARGAIPFYVDPGMGKEKLFDCISEINPDVFIGSPKAQILKFLKKKLFKNIRFSVVANDWVPMAGTNLSFFKKFAPIPMKAVPNSGIAFIAYTSGATGKPKGVSYTYEMIEAQLDILKNKFALKAGGRDLPLLGIFSLFNVALGVTSVFPSMDTAKPLNLDPAKLLRVILDTKVNYSFGSPTLWNKIAEYCVRSRKKLSSLEKIFIAGAPVPESTLARLREVLEKGEIYTPYGATEALPVTMISAEQLTATKRETAVGGELGTLVGKAIEDIELKVVEVSDSVIELDPYNIGEIIVSGQNVSKSYFQMPEADEKSKVIFQDKKWHRMGDMGYLDKSGQLYFCGRKVHMVKGADRTYYSVPVEKTFSQHEKIYRTALIQLNTGEVGLAVEPYPQFFPNTKEEKEHFSESLRFIASSSEITKNIARFFFFENFPVDGRHNAKIFRDKLGQRASKSSGKKAAA